MKLPASFVTAALCMVFAHAAHAQDPTEPPPQLDPNAPVDPNAAFDPSADPSLMYPPPPSVVADPAADPNAGGGGYSVVPAGDQPIDESASYDDGADPNAYMQFQGELSPYGDWYDDPQYGRVWSPSANIVGADFSPYDTNGSWALSQYGWTWNSNYAWGWAPFHYGRWVTLASRGWAWVPGTTWGPAWVSWRAGNGYAGWAPLPPRGASLAQPGYGGSCWRFVPVGQLGSARPAYLPPAAVASIYPRTAWYNPARTMTFNQSVVRYNPGPMGLANQSPMRVAPLPRNAFPRTNIGPGGGVPMGSRPWMGQPQGYAQPYRQPMYAQPQYRPQQPVYQQQFRPQQPVYAQPQYRPQAPMFAQPQYRPQAPVYAQPQYRPQAPVYAQPQYRPQAPVYQQPHWGGGGFGGGGGGFGGGGGHFGGGGFGGGRRGR